MSNESNLKLKVKVDSSELDKLSSKLKGINNAAEGGSTPTSGGEPAAAVKAKKVKVATEELSNSQKYAAEVSKLLSEEQSQLATNFDFAEVSQKALGQAMQQFGGISAANVGILMGGVAAIGALVSVGYDYYGAINQQSIALKEAGIASEGYSTSLYTLITAEQALALAASNTSIGISTNINDLEQYGMSLTAIKSRYGQAGEGIINRALEGDAAAMRMLGIRVDETSTRLERQREARLRFAQTPVLEIREQGGIVGTAVKWAGDAAAFFGFIVASIERIKQRNQEEQNAAQQRNAANTAQEDAEERLQRVRTDFANQLAQYDRDRMDRSIRLGTTVATSDEELARERRVNEEEYQRLQNTTGLTGQALQNRLNQLREAGTRIQQIDAENARRNQTAAGIRERLREEAIRRGLEAGRTVNQLERVQISNGRIRAELELRIAELRKRLVGLTGQDAQAVRNQIAGIISQLQSINPGGSRPLIALTEIRDMVLQIRRASEEFSQNEFIRAIQRGTVSIEEQMNRFSELSDRRRDTEARYRETLYQTDILQARIEEARTSRERQRNAELLRKTNEEAGRLHTILGQVNSEYEAVSQAISRQNQEEIRGLLSANLDADKRIYDSSTNRLENQSRDFQVNLGQQRSYVEATIALLDGSASDYQRTIANLFSPEELQASFGDIVRNATDTLENERTRLEQLRTSGASNEALMSQEQRVADAARNQAQATREAAQAQADLNQRMRESSFGGQFAKTMTNNAKGLATMGEYAGGIAAKGLNLASDAIWAGIDALKSGEEVGPALAKMLSATLQSIGQEATVRALMETAAGFAALANPVTVPLAGGHFAAAAVYASVATAAGVGYAALPSPPEKGKKEKEKEDKDREFLNAQRKEQTIILNGSAIMTKEERAKFIRELSSYGKNL